MSVSRAIAPKTAPSHDELTAAMVGIGMRFAASGAVSPNIEDTIFFASEEGMDRDDLRTLALLVTWFGVHSAWVNASRLTKLVKTRGSARVQAFWSALAGWQSKDVRFARLKALATRERISVPSSASTFLVRRHGEDPRFIGSPIRVCSQRASRPARRRSRAGGVGAHPSRLSESSEELERQSFALAEGSESPAATWPLMPSRVPSSMHSSLHSGLGLKQGRLEATLEGTREGRRHFASARNSGPDRLLLRVTGPLTVEAA